MTNSSSNNPSKGTLNDSVDSLFAVKLTCLSAISFIGIIGNVLICVALIGRKCKSSECFILNLAITDLMVCAIGIPLDIYQELHVTWMTWMYGAVLCKVVWPSQTLLVLVSILTLTAMSLERYRAIITPLKPKVKKPGIIKAIFVIWIMGIAVVCPYVNVLIIDKGECVEDWPKRDRNYYTLALFIIDYCVPLTIISYCYSRVGFRLYKNNQQFNAGSKSGHLSRVQNDAKRSRLQRNTRIIKVFSFAVVMFVVCMLPGDSYWMWKTWGGGTLLYEKHFESFSTILLYANSAINPFIFGTCNLSCLQTLCLRRKSKNNSYSLRFSFTSSFRRRNRGASVNHWRRVARKVRDKKLTTVVIWESNV